MGKIKFLKEDGENFEVGDTVVFEYTVEAKRPFEDSRSLSNPDTVEITVEDTYNDTTVVDAASMTKKSTGQFFYSYDTTGEDSGDRKLTVEVAGSGSEEKEIDWIRLTD